MRPPIQYYGGKQNLVKYILPHVPKHDTYVEVFAGAASLFFAKQRAKVNVINDIDRDIYNLYYVLRSKKLYHEFRRLCDFTPYSRDTYNDCIKIMYSDKKTNRIIRAWAYYNFINQTFSGFAKKNKGWSYSVSPSSNKARSLLAKIARLTDAHRKLMGVHIDNLQFHDLISRYDRRQTFFYLDPPYAQSTLIEKKAYRFNMSILEHKKLVDILLKIRGKAILSGYKHSVYNRLEETGWQRKDLKVRTQAENARRTNLRANRIESLWISPSCKE